MPSNGISIRLLGGPGGDRTEHLYMRIGLEGEDDVRYVVARSKEQEMPLQWLRASVTTAKDPEAAARWAARTFRAELYVRPEKMPLLRKPCYTYSGTYSLRPFEGERGWTLELGARLVDGSTPIESSGSVALEWDAALVHLETLATRFDAVVAAFEPGPTAEQAALTTSAVSRAVEEGRRLARVGTQVSPGYRPGDADERGAKVMAALEALSVTVDAALDQAVELHLRVQEGRAEITAAEDLRVLAEVTGELNEHLGREAP